MTDLRRLLDEELSKREALLLESEILYGPPPMLFIYCVSVDEGRYYWQREHPEFLERFVRYFTSSSRHMSRGRAFQRDDIIMAVGRYYDDPLFPMFMDIERSIRANTPVEDWPRQELHLR